MQSSTDLNTVLSVKSNEYSVFNYTSQIGPEAPGFFQWDANNYLLYISSVGADGKGYMYVLHNDGQDLLGPWTDLGPVRFANGTALQNYDAFPFVHPNGKRYLYVEIRSHDPFTTFLTCNPLPFAQDVLGLVFCKVSCVALSVLASYSLSKPSSPGSPS